MRFDIYFFHPDKLLFLDFIFKVESRRFATRNYWFHLVPSIQYFFPRLNFAFWRMTVKFQMKSRPWKADYSSSSVLKLPFSFRSSKIYTNCWILKFEILHLSWLHFTYSTSSLARKKENFLTFWKVSKEIFWMLINFGNEWSTKTSSN